MQGSFPITINETVYRVEGNSCHSTLLSFLRESGFQDVMAPRGSQNAGPDVLLALDLSAAGRNAYRMLPSALLPLPMCAGRTFWTPDFLLNATPKHRALELLESHAPALPNTAQRAVATALFEAWYRENLTSPASVREGFEAFSFRYGGFRGLFAASEELFAEVAEIRSRVAQAPEGTGISSLRRRTQAAAADPFQDQWSPRLQEVAPTLQPINYVDADGRRFYRAATMTETLRLLHEYPDSVLLHSGLSWHREEHPPHLPACLITTDGIAELHIILPQGNEIEIGAENTLSLLQEAVTGDFPELESFVCRIEARPHRNRLTIAEHLLEPDRIPTAALPLYTSDARIRIATGEGERDLDVDALYRTRFTSGLRSNELIKSIIVTKPEKARAFEQCYIFGPGATNQSVIGGAGFRVELDRADRVLSARIALAGFDQKLPFKRCKAVEETLVGKNWDESTIEIVADLMMEGIDARSDQLASAEKRRKLGPNSLRRFFEDHRLEQLKATELPIALPGT
ncbi:MAG: FAD binding domain-containing protein [Verrucomicrobiota bacterium]